MICPECGEESFARKKVVMEGWKVAGSVEVCALCGAELPAVKTPQDAKTPSSEEAKKERLSALLGGEKTETVTLAGSADEDFCRNCIHFLVHPFKSICALTEKDADPNAGCPSFRRK